MLVHLNYYPRTKCKCWDTFLAIPGPSVEIHNLPSQDSNVGTLKLLSHGQVLGHIIYYPRTQVLAHFISIPEPSVGIHNLRSQDSSVRTLNLLSQDQVLGH